MPEVVLHEIKRPEQLPDWASLEKLAVFFHEKMKPYHDTQEDAARGIGYAFDPQRGGFLVLAEQDSRVVGGLVMLDTHMGGYIPRNLLLFIAVEPELRGRGIGRQLMEKAATMCEGPIKLHVEPDNPAKRLYERMGFEPKYLEMRWSRS